MAAPKSKSGDLEIQPEVQISGEAEQTSEPYIGRWNRLVSTTNWEKGRIILQWRQALKDAGASAAEYSDEAWGRLVGGVTGQHVGRLRRVHQRFGGVFEQYDGLYWSHFQAGLDWDDAEMWLEGAVQNGWSVSQMRAKRWETLGAVEAERPRDEEIVAGELDEDFEPAQGASPDVLTGKYEAVQGAPPVEGPDFGDEDAIPAGTRGGTEPKSKAAKQGEPVATVRPFEDLPELPDDLADAFEMFKLAILRHKTTAWEEVSRDDVLASLDALKQLAVAPSTDQPPF